MVYDYAGKADLSRGHWNPKRKLGVTRHFLAIISNNFLKKKTVKYKAKNV